MVMVVQRVAKMTEWQGRLVQGSRGTVVREAWYKRDLGGIKVASSSKRKRRCDGRRLSAVLQ